MGNMYWSDILSAVLAAVAVIIAAASLWISRRAHKLSEIQALPKVTLVRSWSSQGERGLYIKLEPMPDRHDWLIASVAIRRNWPNWRQRCFLARGEVSETFDDGIYYPDFRRIGHWESRVTYKLELREIAVFLHPDAPDCDVRLEITLSTSPSPVIKRYVKSPRQSTFS